jgi:hypothetical protein
MKRMAWKIPAKIGNVAVRQKGDPYTIDSGPLKGEKFVSLVPVDDEDHSRWEFRKSTGRIIHTINRDGDVIR